MWVCLCRGCLLCMWLEMRRGGLVVLLLIGELQGFMRPRVASAHKPGLLPGRGVLQQMGGLPPET